MDLKRLKQILLYALGKFTREKFNSGIFITSYLTVLNLFFCVQQFLIF